MPIGYTSSYAKILLPLHIPNHVEDLSDQVVPIFTLETERKAQMPLVLREIDLHSKYGTGSLTESG